MKIAQVAPLAESVPPQLYGGTERVVSYLTEELVRQGHEVTLFASGDSVTAAELRPVVPRALRLDPAVVDPLAPHVLLVEQVAAAAREFDFIHFHIDYLHFPSMRRLGVPHATTLHNRLDTADLLPLYREFLEIPLVSISDSQRAPLPFVNWQATVYHGLPQALHRFHPHAQGDYLAFLGRVSPEKGLDRAIEIARRAGIPLKIAAKIDAKDREYFASVITPLLGPEVEYVGEVNEQDKCDLLGQALALIFPIDWPEPFGMVMIESLACGTPVIAFRRGSVPEVLTDGVTGCIVDDVAGAVAAVARVGALSRQACRGAFDRRFSVQRMCADYLEVYRTLAGSAHEPPRTLLFDGAI